MGREVALACSTRWFIAMLSNISPIRFERKPWFAVQVNQRHEEKVPSLLECKNCRHFLPTCRVRRRWSERIKVLDGPLFPGYWFRQSRASVVSEFRGTPGIIRIVRFRGRLCALPGVLPDFEIEDLLRVSGKQA